MPRRLLVLGGGVVGVELARAWASLGSEVTLVEAGPRILAREDPFAAQDIADGLRARGVGVREGVKTTAAAREDGDVVLTLETGERLRGEELLVAVVLRPSPPRRR